MPGTGAPCVDRKIALGLLTPFKPRLGHREHADLVDRAEAVLDRAHQAEARMRVALEVQHGVDHVLEHARAGERALLGDVAHQHDRRAARSWLTRVSCAAHSRTCATEPGADVERVGEHGLDRVDHAERRLLGFDRRDDASRAGSRPARAPAASRRPSRRARSAHLRGRLLAGDVEHRHLLRQRARPPAAAASTCRCRGRRRSARRRLRRCRRRARGRVRSRPVGERSISAASICDSVATGCIGAAVL